jgi:hypothetical protein
MVGITEPASWICFLDLPLYAARKLGCAARLLAFAAKNAYNTNMQKNCRGLRESHNWRGAPGDA